MATGGSSASSKEDTAPRTLFDKILKKEIPSECVYEDEKIYAFKDINPQAPVHFLVIPKDRDGLTQLRNAKEDQDALIGYMMRKASDIALELGLDKGFRVVVNDGPEGCQSVYHLHLHVIGGRQLKWPPGQ